MKDQIRSFAFAAALLAAMAMTVIACGGRQTMASKSAAAYDEAKKKGVPIETGEHGGHSANAAMESEATAATKSAHASTPGMDHSRMPGMDHGAMPGMKHSQPSGAEHSPMSGMNHSAMSGMDHAKMPGMQHGKPIAAGKSMAGMDHSTMPEMAHGSTAGMQHSSTARPAVVIAPPTTNAAIAQTQPAATLRADEFDAPAPAAVEEAAKAASGMSHSMDGAAPTQHEPKPPQPHPPSHPPHNGNGEGS